MRKTPATKRRGSRQGGAGGNESGQKGEDSVSNELGGPRTKKNKKNKILKTSEREGFEPPVTVKPRWFSKPEHSTTLPPFQKLKEIIQQKIKKNQPFLFLENISFLTHNFYIFEANK